MNEYLLYVLIGGLAGFGSGMFGIGGGSIRTPLLNLAGLPLINAYAINLLTIPFSSSVGAASHRKNLHMPTAKLLIAGGVPGSVLGAFLVGLFSSRALALLFFLVSVLTVAGSYLRIAPKDARRRPHRTGILIGSFLLNLLIGMRGGSGGSLSPVFLQMMGLNVRQAVANSLFCTIFSSAIATLIYWGRGDILWLPAFCVIVGSIIGARIGSLVSLKTKPTWLRIGLSLVVLGFASVVLWKNL